MIEQLWDVYWASFTLRVHSHSRKQDLKKTLIMNIQDKYYYNDKDKTSDNLNQQLATLAALFWSVLDLFLEIFSLNVRMDYFVIYNIN